MGVTRFGPAGRHRRVPSPVKPFSSDRSSTAPGLGGRAAAAAAKPITRNRSPVGRLCFRSTITKEIRPFSACNKPIYYTAAARRLPTFPRHRSAILQ